MLCAATVGALVAPVVGPFLAVCVTILLWIPGGLLMEANLDRRRERRRAQ
jgi:hypothetical protein